MGTSTKFVKNLDRGFLFPATVVEITPELRIIVGGSANCVFYQSQQQSLLVNTMQDGQAGEFVRKTLLAWLGQTQQKLMIVSTQNGPHFMGDFKNYQYKLPAEYEVQLVDQMQESGARVLNLQTLHVEIFGFGKIFSESDNVVQLTDTASGKRIVHLGGLFYNKIHPPLNSTNSKHLKAWVAVLDKFIELSQADTLFVPGEGALATSADVINFKNYLVSLQDPKVSFAECRKNYDWAEIIGLTSLEENFDLCRNKIETHAHF